MVALLVGVVCEEQPLCCPPESWGTEEVWLREVAQRAHCTAGGGRAPWVRLPSTHEQDRVWRANVARCSARAVMGAWCMNCHRMNCHCPAYTPCFWEGLQAIAVERVLKGAREIGLQARVGPPLGLGLLGAQREGFRRRLAGWRPMPPPPEFLPSVPKFPS